MLRLFLHENTLVYNRLFKHLTSAEITSSQPPKTDMDISARNKIYELVTHRNSQRIRFVDKSQENGKSYFEVDGKRVIGLHNFVKKVFTHSPQSSTETYDPRTRYTGRELEIVQSKSKCLETKPICHGKRVDDQFCMFSRHLNSRTLSEFKKHFENKDNDPIDPCTVQLIEFFQKTHRWVPSVTQQPIFSSYLNMATAIDVVAKTEDDRQTILGELKTSTSMTDTRYGDYTEYIAIDHDYNVGYINKDTPEMELKKYKLCIANSQYTLDQIQLLLMKWILKEEYNYTFDQYCIVRIHLIQPKLYYLDSKLNHIAPIVIKSMKKTIDNLR